VIAITLPICLIIALGYGAIRSGHVAPDDIRAERKFDLMAAPGTDLLGVPSTQHPSALAGLDRAGDDLRTLGERGGARPAGGVFGAVPWPPHHRSPRRVAGGARRGSSRRRADPQPLPQLGPGAAPDAIGPIPGDCILHLQLADAPRLAMAAGLPAFPPAAPVQAVDFIGFATCPDAAPALVSLLAACGFARAGAHVSKAVTLWRQGGINLLLNCENEGFAHTADAVDGTTVSEIALAMPLAASTSITPTERPRSASRSTPRILKRLPARPLRSPIPLSSTPIWALRTKVVSLPQALPRARAPVDAGFKPHPGQGKTRVLGGDVAAGGGDERAAAKPAKGGVENPHPGLQVGQPQPAGVKQMQAERQGYRI